LRDQLRRAVGSLTASVSERAQTICLTLAKRVAELQQRVTDLEAAPVKRRRA
jgi:hypothetical protein